MRLPTLRGVISRRILVNYRVDADIAARLLPPPFRPKLTAGHAMAGICLIRLQKIRPAFIPFALGFGSENAAHRIAVEWERNGQTEEGVYVPRRDTSSRLSTLLGGRIVPGEQHHARFEIEETDDRVQVAVESDDRLVRMKVVAKVACDLNPGSSFANLAEASRFFEAGATGYSATRDPSRFDGLELRCKGWKVQPLAVELVQSSFFDDLTQFPAGSATFDCALLMRNVDHVWHTREDLCCSMPTATL